MVFNEFCSRYHLFIVFQDIKHICNNPSSDLKKELYLSWKSGLISLFGPYDKKKIKSTV